MRVKVELLNRENEKSKEQIKVLKDKIETIL